jgi:hypothetical protein
MYKNILEIWLMTYIIKICNAFQSKNIQFLYFKLFLKLGIINIALSLS